MSRVNLLCSGWKVSMYVLSKKSWRAERAGSGSCRGNSRVIFNADESGRMSSINGRMFIAMQRVAVRGVWRQWPSGRYSSTTGNPQEKTENGTKREKRTVEKRKVKNGSFVLFCSFSAVCNCCSFALLPSALIKDTYYCRAVDDIFPDRPPLQRLREEVHEPLWSWCVLLTISSC